ncbi:MAG: hypothetical protein IPK50_13485 [Fibrobacterota bacterium]|nr:hypothetical protein [Fibrobacterota bacterium]QQS03319.1 MAG: hypothetical protein IPK50_13485 [Fibrobacterota bacterium]
MFTIVSEFPSTESQNFKNSTSIALSSVMRRFPSERISYTNPLENLEVPFFTVLLIPVPSALKVTSTAPSELCQTPTIVEVILGLLSEPADGVVALSQEDNSTAVVAKTRHEQSAKMRFTGQTFAGWTGQSDSGFLINLE